MFCVEGNVNTPELGAGRGGGLGQGLPANESYKSPFRAGSRSEAHTNHHTTNTMTTASAVASAAAATALHALAEAAQSPKALFPVSAIASPQPTRTPPACSFPDLYSYIKET
jgi:hypothetical protein